MTESLDCFANYDKFNQKDQKRLESALQDGTLVFPKSFSPTKKVAFVKASKQHYVGMIVGKKGTNIMQKRNQTNTDVQNPQQDDEPTFRVYGESYKDLAEMALWILEQDDRLSGKDSNNGRFKTEARIWCCPKYVGLLVGPNGGTIRQIMEDTACSIQSPPRNEKVKFFNLTGSVEEISMAFAEMDYLIKQKYNNDQSGYYNSNKTCDCVNVCERLKLFTAEGDGPATQLSHLNMPLNMPNVNTMNNTSPPIPPSPSNKIPYNSPYITPDQLVRGQHGDLEGDFSQTTRNTPSIRGSRVFSGGNNRTRNTSPNYMPHPPTPFTAGTDNSMPGSPPYSNQQTQLSYNSHPNKELLDLLNLQNYNLNFNEDLVRLLPLLLEFQNHQMNQSCSPKTASSVNDRSSPYANQSLANDFVNSPKNINRLPETMTQCPVDILSEMSRLSLNPGMNGRETVSRPSQNVFDGIHFASF